MHDDRINQHPCQTRGILCPGVAKLCQFTRSHRIGLRQTTLFAFRDGASGLVNITGSVLQVRVSPAMRRNKFVTTPFGWYASSTRVGNVPPRRMVAPNGRTLDRIGHAIPEAHRL